MSGNYLPSLVAEALNKGIASVDRLITEFDLSGLHSTATYLRNAGHDLFTVREVWGGRMTVPSELPGC